MSPSNPYEAPDPARGGPAERGDASSDGAGAYALGVLLMQGAAAAVVGLVALVLVAMGASEGDGGAVAVGVMLGVAVLALGVLMIGSLIAWRGGAESVRRTWLFTLVGWMILGVWPAALLVVGVWLSND